MNSLARLFWRDFFIALGIVLCATLLRFATAQYFPNGVAIPFFILAIIICGRVGGPYAPWLALALGSMPSSYFRSLQDGTFTLVPLAVPAALLIFLGTGTTIAWLGRSERKAREAAERSATEARERQRQLEAEIAERKAIEDTLRARETELKASEKLFHSFMDSVPVSAYMKDLQGRFVYLNRLTDDTFNHRRTDCLGKTSFELYPQHIAAELRRHDEQVLQENRLIVFEETTTTVAGANPREWLSFKFPVVDAHGTRLLAGMSLDITEKKLAELKRRESEDRFRQLAENIREVFWVSDPAQLSSLYVSPAYEEVWGRTCESLYAHPSLFLETIHPEDRDRFVAKMKHHATGENTDEEYRIVRPDGTERWIRDRGFPIRDESGCVVRVVGIAEDITERKQTTEALKAEREFLQHTLEAQDQERQLVAYEIHDGLVQYAAAALMQLESIQGQTESEFVTKRIQDVANAVRKVIIEGRRIMNGVRTPVLDDWGIIAAIEQLISDEDRAHVEIEFIKDKSVERLAPNIEEALFRITQEALTNVHKHSQTARVQIELVRRGDRVHLEIRDWGIGFDPKHSSKGIHGLKGMVERARIVGGRCDFESAPGKGTRIHVELPFVERPQKIVRTPGEVIGSTT